SSEFYEDMYEKGWIDESYSYDFSLEKGFGFAMVGSDTQEPEKLELAIKEVMNQSAIELPFDQEMLERVKRRKIGFFLRALNSIEFIANQFTRYQFNDMNLFDAVPVIEELTIEDVKEAMKSIQGESQQAIFTVLPLKEQA
ncbi:MAG: peptidase M16, partial [Kurthia sp.]